jgi:hypothetical protein
MAEDPEPEVALRASLREADLKQLKDRLKHLNDNRQSFCSKLVNQAPAFPHIRVVLGEHAERPSLATVESSAHDQNMVVTSTAVEDVVEQLHQESLRGSAEFLLGRFRLGGEQAGSASSLAAWFKGLESERWASLQSWKGNILDTSAPSR